MIFCTRLPTFIVINSYDNAFSSNVVLTGKRETKIEAVTASIFVMCNHGVLTEQITGIVVNKYAKSRLHCHQNYGASKIITMMVTMLL